MKSADQDHAPNRGWLNRTVIAVGLGSLLSDTSHEMATAVLPLFLATLVGSSGPAVLGLIEGSADLLSSAAKLWAGSIGDRLNERRFWTGAGYLVTALSKASFALATTWWQILLGRVLAWSGGASAPLCAMRYWWTTRCLRTTAKPLDWSAPVTRREQCSVRR